MSPGVLSPGLNLTPEARSWEGPLEEVGWWEGTASIAIFADTRGPRGLLSRLNAGQDQRVKGIYRGGALPSYPPMASRIASRSSSLSGTPTMVLLTEPCGSRTTVVGVARMRYRSPAPGSRLRSTSRQVTPLPSSFTRPSTRALAGRQGGQPGWVNTSTSTTPPSPALSGVRSVTTSSSREPSHPGKRKASRDRVARKARMISAAKRPGLGCIPSPLDSQPPALRRRRRDCLRNPGYARSLLSSVFNMDPRLEK